MNDQPPPGAGSGLDLAMVALRRAREDARLYRFTDQAPSARRRRVRGRTPPVHVGQALLDVFAVIASPLPAWSVVAGPMARHVYPTDFDADSGTLTLTSSSAAWLTNVRLLADALVRKLNEELGPVTVRRLRLLKLDPSAGPPPPPASASIVPRPLWPPPALLPDSGVQAALNRQAEQLPREAGQFLPGEQDESLIIRR
ncbi:DUF721 domain-containing protein [Streptomyces sp. NPDC002755]|uniref:DUF721 domain-containing protein n=1 Tax=Streptomyces sp. NPDC002884 TaxID=3154544 RepID=UPI003333C01F